MNKQKKCKQCKLLFWPRTSMEKFCGMACSLDSIEKNMNAKSKKPKAKQKTVGKLRLDLWDVFSLYIKVLHSKDGEWCSCYTCDKPIKIGTIDCQGGHAFSKAANGNLYFDERAVRPQCSYCNCGEEGNHYIFNERLKQEIGLPAWNDMYQKRKQLFKKPRSWYMEAIEYYKAQTNSMLSLKKLSPPESV
jgi:hypothetical protein